MKKELKINFAKSKVMVAVLLIIVLSSLIGGYIFYRTPMSYVSIDINPGVEIGVNAFDQVVSATGSDDAGEIILSNQDIINNSVTDAIDKLVSSASDNGFIAEDGSTIISVVSETDNTDLATKLQSNVEQGINNALSKTSKSAVVFKENFGLANRAEALELGITPGKLHLIKALQAVDPTATIDQYKDSKVSDIMKQIIAISHPNNPTKSQDVTPDVNLEKINDAVQNSNAKASKSNANNATTTDGTNNKNSNNNNKSASNNSVNNNSNDATQDNSVDNNSNKSTPNTNKAPNENATTKKPTTNKGKSPK